MSELERARIRAEIRYALLVVEEARPREEPKSKIEKFFSYVSNGFILLIIGSLITSFLVPRYQREYENRKQQISLMQECLAQFLLYSNSIWQEYYAILPLTQKTDITKDEYLHFLTEVTQVKLKRYDAHAKIQALTVAYRPSAENKEVDAAVENYAIKLNQVSSEIDKWLTGLYCTPTQRDISPCAAFDPTFDAFTGYIEIKNMVIEIGNRGSKDVASLMVRKITEH